MKNMKRLLLSISAVVLALAFTACSGTGDTSSDGSAAAEFDTSKSFNVISREDGSGTRSAFIELFGIEEEDESGEKVDKTIDTAEITDNTAVMLTTVAGNPYSIGYISLGSLSDDVKALKIDGADASVENVNNGSYTIVRPFNIATKGTPDEVTQDFINFIMSADGQKVIEDEGYISVGDKPAFTSTKPEGKVTVGGSSSVTPVMEKLKEAYQAVNPNAEIEIQQSDSTTGMNGAIDGTFSIGMASRALKDSETSAGLTGLEIAKDGIAVIVNKENSISDISKDDIKAIYTGTKTTWSEIAQ